MRETNLIFEKDKYQYERIRDKLHQKISKDICFFLKKIEVNRTRFLVIAKLKNIYDKQASTKSYTIIITMSYRNEENSTKSLREDFLHSIDKSVSSFRVT